MESLTADFCANCECRATKQILFPAASSIYLIRFRNMWKYWSNFMTRYYLLLQNVRIISGKATGVHFTFSCTKVVETLPMHILHTLNAILKFKLCLLLKF